MNGNYIIIHWCQLGIGNHHPTGEGLGKTVSARAATRSPSVAMVAKEGRPVE